MHTILLIINIISAVLLVIAILLQSGSSDMGALFGGASTETVFGAEGASSFLVKATAILATIFLLTSLSLAYMSGKKKVRSVVLTGEKKVVIEKKEKEPRLPVNATR